MSAHRRLPLTRGDCIDGPRPCPHGSCRYHLGPELARRDAEPEYFSSCALDIAELGGASVDEVAAVMGLSTAEIEDIVRRAGASLVRALEGSPI